MFHLTCKCMFLYVCLLFIYRNEKNMHISKTDIHADHRFFLLAYHAKGYIPGRGLKQLENQSNLKKQAVLYIFQTKTC